MNLTKKEQSRLRRLLREHARARQKGWEDDMEILEADIRILMDKMEQAKVEGYNA